MTNMITHIHTTNREYPKSFARKKTQFIYKQATTQTPIITKQNTTSHTTRQRTLRHTPPAREHHVTHHQAVITGDPDRSVYIYSQFSFSNYSSSYFISVLYLPGNFQQ